MNFRELQSRHLHALHPEAKVLLSAVPGGQNDLSSDLAAIEAAGVDLVLCLLRDGELGSYGRTVTGAGGRKFRWQHCPLPASCGDENAEALRASLGDAILALETGQTLLIHCQLGQVRTGCAAASLLALLGASPQEAANAVEAAGSLPFSDGPLPLFDAICAATPTP